jgi:hypothetical protein
MALPWACGSLSLHANGCGQSFVEVCLRWETWTGRRRSTLGDDDATEEKRPSDLPFSPCDYRSNARRNRMILMPADLG